MTGRAPREAARARLARLLDGLGLVPSPPSPCPYLRPRLAARGAAAGAAHAAALRAVPRPELPPPAGPRLPPAVRRLPRVPAAARRFAAVPADPRSAALREEERGHPGRGGPPDAERREARGLQALPGGPPRRRHERQLGGVQRVSPRGAEMSARGGLPRRRAARRCGDLRRRRSALSAVYFYFDPELEARAPGTFNVLWLVEEARRLSRPWLYLATTWPAARAWRTRPASTRTSSWTTGRFRPGAGEWR